MEAHTHLTCQLVAGPYRAPTAALRSDIADGSLMAAVNVLAQELGLDLPAISRPDDATLQASYVDLFVSSARGVAAPPYAGYALDGELLGPSVQELGRIYQAHGVTLSNDWHDLPDHIAAVAEAGALLSEAGHHDAARELLARFLAPWFERFAATVETTDVSGFYGPLTRFLDAVIREVCREGGS